ncbi:MAG: MFS transporter [Chthonomonas sp.]
MTERLRWQILFVAWLGWVFDIMDTALFNLAKSRMLTDLLGVEGYAARGPQIEGLIQTVFIVGWAVGGLAFGVLADRWGRSRTMILTILLYCCFTALTAACQTWEQVAVVRFLTGLGIGGEWAAGAALIAEVFPDSKRPLAAALLQTAAAVGPVLAATANLGLAHQSWHWMFLIGLAPAIVTVFIRTIVKEPEKRPDPQPAGSLKELFGPGPWRKRALVAMVIGTVGIAGAGNAAYWMPNLVREASQGLADAEIAARTSFVTYAQHGGTLLGVFAFPLLAKRLGRRPALVLGFVGAPLVTWFALQGKVTYESLLWIAPTISCLSIGLTAIYGLYFPELFPTRLRATGSGFAYNTARIAQSPLPWVTGLLIGADKSSPAHGVAMAALVYVLGLAALPFAPETKDKPLPA